MRPKIYLFGDSITESSFVDGGWGAALAHRFSRKADVVVRGYSGYNTRWAIKVLERVFPASEERSAGADAGAPLAVTVFFGANDACLPDRYAAFQHVPINEYKQNLILMVSFFKKKWPATRILLITPPPIDEEGRIQNPYIENPPNESERTNNAAGDYAKACIAAAKECGVSVIDIWTKMQQVHGWEKACLSDGLHLTRNGNTIVFEEVVRKLGEAGLSPETLPADLPLLSEIDFNDPLKAFQK